MTARFIVRLLDAESSLLAWAEVHATAKPQARPAASCPFWPTDRIQMVIERDGQATQVSVHWCDLDVARVEALGGDPVPVRTGQVFNFAMLGPVWLVPGMRDVPLPTITVRQAVTISPPTGGIGLVTG